MNQLQWQHFLLFPLTYLLLVLPAVLLGRPLWDTISLYWNQTGSIGSGLNYNSPSIFAILWKIPESQQKNASTVGIVAAALYMLNLLAIAYVKRSKLTDRAILALALLFSIGIPFLLPHMHDRYFFPADILSLVLAFAYLPVFLVAPLVEFASLLGYHAYLKMRYLLYMYYGAYALIAAMALALLVFACSLKEPAPPTKKKPKPKKKTT